MAKNFNEIGNLGGDSLLIVDGLNLAFRFKYAKKKTFAEEYCGTVASLAKSYKAKKVIILTDKGSSFRRGILESYKVARREKAESQTEEEKQEMEEFFNEFNNNTVEKLIEEYEYTVLGYPGVEADDIAAYISKTQVSKYEHIWLISSDKDWDLLINPKVSRFSYVTRKEITYHNWSEHYNYDIEQHISIKVLMGDSGDSVPGVPGVGPKRAEELVAKYGNALELYDNLPLKGKAKYIQNLNEFGDNIMLNYMLMDLPTYCEDAIGNEYLKQLDEVLNNV